MLTSNLATKGVQDMYAIIIIGGKQHKVEEGQEILVEKIKGDAGDKIEVGETIFLSTNGDRVVTKDELANVKVKGEIVEQTKDDKIIVFKYKPKKGYRRKRGHRRLLTRVRIEDISFPGKPDKPGKPEKQEKPKEVEEKPTKIEKKVKKKPKAVAKSKTKAKAEKKVAKIKTKKPKSTKKAKKTDKKDK
jgi:large subunit ribosomal protein L21